MTEDARYLAERKNARDWRLRAPYEWLDDMRTCYQPDVSLADFERGLRASIGLKRLGEALSNQMAGSGDGRGGDGLDDHSARLVEVFFDAVRAGTIAPEGLRSLRDEIRAELAAFLQWSVKYASSYLSERARKCVREVEQLERDAQMAGSFDDRKNVRRRIGFAAGVFARSIDDLRTVGLLAADQSAVSETLLGALRERMQELLAIDEPFFEAERNSIRSGALHGQGFRERMLEYRYSDDYWRRLFGWSEELPKDARTDPDMVHYESTDPETFLEVLDRLDLRPGEVFYDIGCGRGGLVMMAELATGAKAKGVEFQPALAEQARAAIRSLGLNAEIVNADIREADVSDGDVFYFFNPFGGEIMVSALEKLRRIAETKPIRFCWYGPQGKRVEELVSRWARPVGDGWISVFESLPPSALDSRRSIR